MKKRIRKTGEVVDVISYTAPYGTIRDDTHDFVNYIDSKGREREGVPMNYYWDLEEVEEILTNDIDWETRRYEIARDTMQGILFGFTATKEDVEQSCHDVAQAAILFADALIIELKKREYQ